jgi:hypothetical protein
MYMNPMPEMPQEFIDLAASNPEGFAEAMGSGMEAMAAAMEGGASPGEAFEAMGDAMGPMMEEMGISPEAFDAAGDAVGAAIGPAMHMAPADASPADMGAMMQDGLDMMLPEGVDCPAPIMDAMGDMGAAMGDSGMGCHDVGAEMMGDPGSDTYMLPTDANGGPIVEAGQPETCPADACQSPPEGGQCDTAAPSMMPPEGGYDHAPITGDMVMPEPFEMATPDPTGELSGAENVAGGSGTMAGGSGSAQGAGGTGGGMAGGSGGLSALGGAMGGTGGGAGGSGSAQGAGGTGGGVDAAISNAMDAAQEQGGGNVAGGTGGGAGGTGGGMADATDTDDVDPSAGMG